MKDYSSEYFCFLPPPFPCLHSSTCIIPQLNYILFFSLSSSPSSSIKKKSYTVSGFDSWCYSPAFPLICGKGWKGQFCLVEYGEKERLVLHLLFSFLSKWKWIGIPDPCFVLDTNGVPVFPFWKPAGFLSRKRRRDMKAALCLEESQRVTKPLEITFVAGQGKSERETAYEQRQGR